MPAPTIAERIETARAMIAKIEATLAKLYEKTASSASIGDQSHTHANIRDLSGERERWRNELAVLERQESGTGRTIKVRFPSC